MQIEVKYQGLRVIEENLRILREQFGVRTGGIIIRALRVGAKIIRDEARRRVQHVPSGYAPFESALIWGRGKRQGRAARFKSWDALLRSSIVEHAIPVSSARAGGQPTVIVRVRSRGYSRRNGHIAFNRPGSSAGWWWWLEFGTAKTPARSFMRGAFESKKNEAMQAAIGQMRVEIDAFFKLHLKKAA